MAFPFFAIYLNQRRGVPMTWVGGFLSLSLLANALAQAVGGELSDHWGRRRVMVCSLACRTALLAALAWAVAREASFGALAGLHVAHGFLAHLFDPAARSWIADVTRGHERLRAFGWLRIGTNLGWAVGPALGGFFAERSYAGLFWAGVVASALTLGLVSLCIRDAPEFTANPSVGVRDFLKAADSRTFLSFCLASALLSVAMAQMVVALSVHATEIMGLDNTKVGLLFSLNGLMVVLLQHPLTEALQGFKITSGLGLGSALYAVGYGAIGWAHGFPQLLGLMSVVTLGEILVSPGLSTLAANLAEEDAKGRYMGFHGLFMQLGSALGPLLGGAALEHLSPRSPGIPWILTGGLAAGSGLWFLTLRSRLSPEEEGLDPVGLPKEAPV